MKPVNKVGFYHKMFTFISDNLSEPHLHCSCGICFLHAIFTCEIYCFVKYMNIIVHLDHKLGLE